MNAKLQKIKLAITYNIFLLFLFVILALYLNGLNIKYDNQNQKQTSFKNIFLIVADDLGHKNF